MNGWRVIGKRKAALINGPLNKQIERLAKMNINAMALLSERYDIEEMEDFKKIPTKKISGMISDLAEISS